MPKDFENCVRKKGRVITKSLSASKYMHVCFLNGKSYGGEIKTKKRPTNKTRTLG